MVEARRQRIRSSRGILGPTVALAVVALLLSGCGEDDTTEPPAPTTASDDSVVAATPPSTSGTATTTAVGVDVAIGTTSLGDVLVDAEGMTLYVFLNDTPGTSSCVDACAQTWPPLVAPAVSVGAGLAEGDFGLIGRPDGSLQLAVDDRPLYRFAGDTAPGETTGQGFNDAWYVVGPDGVPVQSA